MPEFRQGSVGHVPTIAIPPVAGSRAGTSNPAGGLSTVIDARGYKSATLSAYAGVVAVSTGAVTAKMQSSALANGGTPADIAGAAIAGFGPNDDNTIQSVDFAIPEGRPYLLVVLTQSQATDVGCAWVTLNGPMSTSRT